MNASEFRFNDGARFSVVSVVSRSFAVGILALLLSTQPGNAQVSKDVDPIFAQSNRAGSPGAAVVVMKNGDVVYQNGYGFANLDYDIPITPTTLFDIASFSKQFTAFAIAMLADRGKLSLDDDVHKYIPEVPDFGKRITIRHLLHHTSGIRDWVELLSIAGYRFDDVISLPDIMNFVQHQQGLNFEPGAEHLYSNTGYNLLAVTVERVSGQPFAQFMEEQIFRPLGMNDTHILMDHQRVMKRRATSYAPNENIGELQRLHRTRPLSDGTWRIWVDNTSAPGSSSVVTSVADLAKWLRNWETGEVGGKRVLQQMVQRGVLNDGQQLNYALGLSLGKYRGLTTVSHGGTWRGFRTHLVRFPDQHLAVAVLGNSTRFDATRSALRVAEVFLRDQLAPVTDDGNFDPPPPLPPVRLTASQLAEYAGDYSSPELGTTYTVAIRDGQLVVQHRKMDEQLLTARDRDRFVSPGVRGQQSYEFTRDASGRITGFSLRGARFRGVRFERK